MTAWDPERELAALLDQLNEELLAATDAEVEAASSWPKGARRQAAQAMRRHLSAAESRLDVPSVRHPALRTGEALPKLQ